MVLSPLFCIEAELINPINVGCVVSGAKGCAFGRQGGHFGETNRALSRDEAGIVERGNGAKSCVYAKDILINLINVG